MKLILGHNSKTLVVERGNYWEAKVRGSSDVDEYEDEPTYRAWTVGFRLTRDTIQGSTDEKEERDPNNHQGEHRVQDRSA